MSSQQRITILMLERLTKLLIFCYLFLTDYRIYSIPTSAILLLSGMVYIFIYSKHRSINPIFRKDKIKGLLFLILMLTVATYVFKSVNIESIKNTYYYHSGNIPDFLYLKMVLNGVFYILMALLAISIGISYSGRESAIKSLIKYLVNLITINALINIIAWGIQTGGVIGRYNFEYPMISSAGINVQLSTIAFILQLSTLQGNKILRFQLIKLVILCLSILVIMTRQGQLLFILIVALYLLLSTRKATKLITSVCTIGIISIIIYYAQSIFDAEVINAYQTMVDPMGVDLTARYDIVVSALKIFKENILFGVGYGMFAGYNTAAVSITGVNINVSSVHNGAISILTEMGIVGLFVNFLLAFHIIKRLNIVRKYCKLKCYNDNKYIIAIFVFITVSIVAALTSNYILLPPPSEYSYYGMAFISWLLIGIVISFEKSEQI